MLELINTLVETERLKRLDRTGWTLRGLPTATESVAAHSFGVAVTAMLLADELTARGVKLDMEKVLRMAIVHDLPEARLGDMPKIAKHYFGTDTFQNAEKAVLADIVNGCSSAGLYRDLFDEYERRQTIEARLVKIADIVDLLIEALALEKAGASGLEEFWDATRERNFDLEPNAQLFVDELFDTLVEMRSEIRQPS